MSSLLNKTIASILQKTDYCNLKTIKDDKSKSFVEKCRLLGEQTRGK